MNVTLATCRSRPELTASDALLAEALRARGVQVRAAPWDAIAPVRPPGSAVCLRSTWDYHIRSTEFRSWVASFVEQPGGLWNPPETVLWNLDKSYLRELAERGIAIPRTHWLEPGYTLDLPAALADSGWHGAVLKPRISATAFSTHLIGPATELSAMQWEPLRASGALLQEFVPEIRSRGELSLVFVGGAFSHAVRKLPTAGEFRVQHDFGGSSTRTEPPPSLVAFGARVLEAFSLLWVYARVDVVDAATGPLLMELELIEPDLFFNLAPEGAGHLAQALVARLGA